MTCVYEVLVMKMTEIRLDGAEGVYLNNGTQRRVYADVGKRIFDVSLTVLFMPIWVPVLLLCMFAIKIEGGQAFFFQKRVGRGGMSFICFKLRTMVPDSEQVLRVEMANNPRLRKEWDQMQKLQNDPRITSVGRFLRACSLDELPQLFNVLRGDMSLVGPRPFLPSQVGLYHTAGHGEYYRMRPGITGPWQVTSRNASAFLTRAGFDSAYFTQQSFWYDVGLLLKTIGVVLRANGR